VDLALDAEITDNTNRTGELVEASPAAALVEETGIGPVTSATVLVAWSHPGRVRDEAAFAALAGVNPVPASSVNTTRHRLTTLREPPTTRTSSKRTAPGPP
jgi:transposase